VIPQDVRTHCNEIDRCNQRGGRMLSVVDLLDARTISPELAGYLLAAIGKYQSFMVGALPGGAGKTAVMGALLNFVPTDVELVPADGRRTVQQGLKDRSARRCYICHEIGSGPYYAYLWGPSLADLLELPSRGHMVATNLHADTIDQAREQICNDNDVPEQSFDRFGLMIFLRLQPGRGGIRRRVARVYEPTDSGPPRLIYCIGSNDQIESVGPSMLVNAEELAAATKRIKALCAGGLRTIAQVRSFLISS
jgi:hypothetical protein